MSVPDYCEYLTGWRMWHVDGFGMFLRSGLARREVLWPYRKALEARHFQFHDEHSLLRIPEFGEGYLFSRAQLRLREAARDASCVCPPCPTHIPSDMPGCGIYALKTPALLIAHSGVYLGVPLDGGMIGKVALWGRFVEHEHGYRAQFAYPLEIVEGPTAASSIAANYGIPYNKENEEWKSALKSNEESLNHWISPSRLSPRPRMVIAPAAHYYIPNPPPNPKLSVFSAFKKSKWSSSAFSWMMPPPEEDDTDAHGGS